MSYIEDMEKNILRPEMKKDVNFGIILRQDKTIPSLHIIEVLYTIFFGFSTQYLLLGHLFGRLNAFLDPGSP